MFCSNCGKELADGAAFCGNCGASVAAPVAAPAASSSAQTATQVAQSAAQTAVHVAQAAGKAAQQAASSVRAAASSVDLTKIWAAIKGHFTGLRMDYSSSCFKWAMLLFIAFGVGIPLYSAVGRYLPRAIFVFDGISDIYELVFCLLAGGVAAPFILRKKQPQTVKKSHFLRGFWIVTLLLSLVAFVVTTLYDYVLYSYIARNVIAILTVIACVMLLCGNKPRYPIAAVISAVAFALNYSPLSSIRVNFSWYNMTTVFGDKPSFVDTVELFSVNSGIGGILLPVVLVIIACVMPKKIAKWVMYIPAALMVTVSAICAFSGEFSMWILFSLLNNIAVVTMHLLLARAYVRDTAPDYAMAGAPLTKKAVAAIGGVSLGVMVVLSLVYLIVSAIISTVHVNYVVDTWGESVKDGSLTTAEDWYELHADFNKYSPTKLTENFADGYDTYTTISNNKYTMQRIQECYTAYLKGSVSQEIAEEYEDIRVSDDWSSDPLLKGYYDKYTSMKPTEDKVSVSASISVNGGTIRVTVRNDNAMPLSKCTVSCKFTILYVESGYYSDPEYGRGTKTMIVEDIPGNSDKTETFTFDADDYYDSYGSYIVASLWESSTTLVSVE